jgi:hypothetical protein
MNPIILILTFFLGFNSSPIDDYVNKYGKLLFIRARKFFKNKYLKKKKIRIMISKY